MEKEESDMGHTIALVSLNKELPVGSQEVTLEGEICDDCFCTLRNWLLAPADAALEKPNKSLSDGLHDMVEATTPPVEDAEPAAVKALKPPKPVDKNRGKIEEGELNVVASRFDRNKAASIVNEQKGPCAHHFKRFEEGKILCGGAPPGYTGEHANFSGCGKKLTDAEI
jgi:hypothetical protein